MSCKNRPTCQNCPQMDHSIETQQQEHVDYLRQFLQFPELTWQESPQNLHYRARITLRPNREGALGYFKAKSHEHLAITECPIAHQSINDCLKALPPLPFPAKSVELRSDGTNVVANILSSKGQRPTKEQMQKWAEGRLQGVGLDGQKMWGNCQSKITVAGVEHHLSLNSFYQVNLQINELLVATILEWLSAHEGITQVLDLYCGAGNIGAAIAKSGIKVVGIDNAKSSIQDGKNTIKRSHLPMELRLSNADAFRAGDAFFNAVVLDPPRKGIQTVKKGQHLLSELNLTKPKAIFYVSCNPHALRSDLFLAKKLGYAPYQMRAFNMFPHTKHVETLVELRPI